MQSELLLLRIPIAVGEQLLQEDTDAGSSPLTSSARGPQHFAFVRSVNYHPEGYDTIKSTFIPLPPLSRHFPTPQLFGPPLGIGGWGDLKDTWLHVVPKKFIMLRSRSFKRFSPPVVMSYDEMAQIDRYRNALSATPQNEQGPSDSGPGDNGGTGDASGQRGKDNAGGEGDVGGGSGRLGTGLRKLLCCSGQDRQADEPRDDLSSDTTLTSEHEGVDEDNFATIKDDLILLASTDPLFVPELENVEAEQAERAARVERWLQDVY